MQNLPIDKNFKIDSGPRDKSHVYEGGTYVEVPYVFQEYPKSVGDKVVYSLEEEVEAAKPEKKAK